GYSMLSHSSEPVTHEITLHPMSDFDAQVDQLEALEREICGCADGFCAASAKAPLTHLLHTLPRTDDTGDRTAGEAAQISRIKRLTHRIQDCGSQFEEPVQFDFSMVPPKDRPVFSPATIAFDRMP